MKNCQLFLPKDSDVPVIGEICHIYPSSPLGPRGTFECPFEDVNCFENLLLLCPNHHKIIDSHEEEYPPRSAFKYEKKSSTDGNREIQ